VALARRLGLETGTVVDALGGGPLVSAWQEAKLQRIASGEFCPGREVRAAGFRQLLRGAQSGCRGAQVDGASSAQDQPLRAPTGALSEGWFSAARRTISRGKAGAG
jgi:3-hydroxyisobutyrate dehydrogenase-like beta-hydroxyacid dehydrogenase